MRSCLALLLSLSLGACKFSPDPGAGNNPENDAAVDDASTGDASPLPDGTPVDAVPPDAEPQPITIDFRQGEDGYTGTHDAFINEVEPDLNEGDTGEWRWDLNNTLPTYALLRFDNIFGPGPRQVPTGATILSAELRFVLYDSTGVPPGTIHEVRVPWDEGTVTFNNFGPQPGVQGSDYGSQLHLAPILPSSYDYNMTSSVQAWASSPTDNHGWIVIPGSEDAARCNSSEFAISDVRPRLRIVYMP